MDRKCLNCGAAVHAAFCPECGQQTRESRGPIVSMLAQFLSEFFSFDGRQLRTFRDLWIPGKLTCAYLEGRRASYVPPARMYFVASLLFFLIVGIPAPDAEKINVVIDGEVHGREEIVPGLPTFQLLAFDDSSASEKIESMLDGKAEEMRQRPVQELLDDYFGGMARVVPTAMIFLVPILALVMCVLYFRQPFYFIDHLIFVIHYQSFLFAMFVVMNLLARLGLAKIISNLSIYLGSFLILGPIYLFLALRRIYGQSRLWTTAKTSAVMLLYLILFQLIFSIALIIVIRDL